MLAVAGTLGAAGGALAGVSSAAGGAEPGGTGGANTGANCPSSNPPNALALVAGTPQTAMLGSAFATGLQVALTASDGCPVTSGAAGVPVTFTAPSSGAGGVFATSATSTVTVGADSGGAVQAPTFTANGVAGSFTVTASSQYGSVTFALTNTAAGTPARLVAVSPARQTATVTGGYRRALAVRVLDGNGNPVAGASVTFTLTASTVTNSCGSSSSGGSGAGSSADASFAGGAAEGSARSNAAGVATSPALTANDQAGTFTASATLGSSGSSEPGENEPRANDARANAAATSASAGNLAPALFTLTNRAGAPAKLAPGVGEAQSARVGMRFPVSLAVTVSDAHGNRVPGALVSFAAPAAGPGGRFTTRAASRSHGRQGHARQVRAADVKTNTCGVAIAPPFTANAEPGGYVVQARAGHARAAAFALVNEGA
jgi:protocatechuate 3,4-dioxygenase beta subunit